MIHYPKLSKFDFVFFRMGGPGLGNLLFPVYRAYQEASQAGEEMVFPQFGQFKIGPILRFERDKRLYFDLFKNRSLGEVYLNAKSVFSVASGRNFDSDIKVHSGLGNYFYDLNASLVKDFELYLLGRVSNLDLLKRKIDSIGGNDICVHVRRGDFSKDKSAGGGMNYQIEDEWYVKAVNALVDRGGAGRVRVFSDTNDLSQEFLKKLKCDEVDVSSNAMHSLLIMSKHGTIVCSRSSFSLWSAFLGKQHVVHNHDFDFKKYMPPGFVSRIECI